MRVDPAIAAMRRDRTVLHHAQAAVFDAAQRWSTDPRIAPILEDFATFAHGAALFDCPHLSRLFGPGEAAREFADLLIAGQSAALAAKRFAQIPFRHAFDGRMATLPVFAYYQLTQPGTATQAFLDRAWTAALLLIVLVMALNVVARLISRFFAPKTGR